MTKMGARFGRRILTMILSLGVLLLALPAGAAGGRVEWKTKTLKESDSHRWTIDVAMYLNKAPDVATLPMRFTFQPVVYYERALVDGREGPQERKVPLEGKPPLVESVDVGFLDPGSGVVQKRTKFTFQVSRSHGFEAGEYDVSIKDGRTDASMGAPVRLVFEGENEVIDRRAIVFSGEKKKEKKDDEEKKEEEPKKKELTPDDPAYWQGGPKEDEQKEEVEPKRGCGCRLAAVDTRADQAGLVLAAAALAVQVARRRKAR